MSAPDTRTGGRPKGLPKTGGRKKGTPNRATVALREKLDANRYDPVDELIRIARAPNAPLELRAHIHLAILPYLYPKRKPINDSTEEPMVTNVITDLDGAVGVTNARAESSSEA